MGRKTSGIRITTEKDFIDGKLSHKIPNSNDNNIELPELRFRVFSKQDQRGFVNIGQTDDFLQGIQGYFEDLNGNPFQINENSENYFITLSKCVKGSSRDRGSLRFMLFDIDAINEEHYHDDILLTKYVKVLSDAINLNEKCFNVIRTGNGIHLLIHIADVPEILMSEIKPRYDKVCEQVQNMLNVRKLSGHIDPQVFAPKRMSRIHGTLNVKDGVAKPVKVLQINDIYVTDIDTLLPHVEADKSFIANKVLSRMKFDGPAILEGCKFINDVKENPSHSEPEWYAMLGIVSRVGRETAHEYSKIHPKYSFDETESKIDQALKADSRSCQGIQNIWSKCESCPNFGTISHPLQLKGKDFIATENTGFRVIKSDGSFGRYDPEDIVKANLRKNEILWRANEVITFNKETKLWDVYASDTQSDRIAVMSKRLGEIIPEKTRATKPVDLGTYQKITQLYTIEAIDNVMAMNREIGKKGEFKLALSNGLYDFKNSELRPWKKEDYQMSVLPYRYDPNAKCPRFDRFLLEVTKSSVIEEQQEKMHYLKLMMASILCNHPLNNDGVFYILEGEGRNGKSILMELVAFLVGHEYVSNHDLTDTKRVSHLPTEIMRCKLLLIDEPVSNIFGFKSTQKLKNLATRESQEFRDVNGKGIKGSMRAKIVFTTNNLGELKDKTEGARRRAIIVPFTNQFKRGQEPDLAETLQNEASGVLNRIIEYYTELEKNDFIVKPWDKGVANTRLDEAWEESEIFNFIQDNFDVIRIENPLSPKDMFHFIKDTRDFGVNLHELYPMFCREYPRSMISTTAFHKEVRRYIAQYSGCFDFSNNWTSGYQNKLKAREGNRQVRKLPLRSWGNVDGGDIQHV